MTVSLQDKSVYTLILNCVDKQVPVPEFLNLYKEFYSEKFSTVLGNDDSENDINNTIEVSNNLSDDFVRLLNSKKPIVIAEYLTEILFGNYNSDLIKSFMPKLSSVHENKMLVHFFSRASLHFSTLNDKLIIDQLNKDLPDSIIPNLFTLEVNLTDNELTVTLFKFLQSIVNLATSPIILSTQYSDGSQDLLRKLSKVNKLLYRRISQVFDSKISFKDSKHLIKDIRQEYISSPSITSPQFISSPLSMMKTPMSTSGPSAAKYKDLKLLRYYKNIWLNNKIIKWEPINSDFLARYASISNSIFQENAPSPQITDALLTDLIETSFTCFAQFVSNKQYHQTNANLNLLERQWIIFISKHLPILVLKHSSSNPQVVTNALEKIDTKVIKAIKAYYSEKDDMKNRNEDLFEDYPTASLDIRHDFIKSLIMLGLQPPQFINDFLRDDQILDPKSLPTTDDLFIQTQQGTQEIVSNIPTFITDSLNSLELQTILNHNNEPNNGIHQIFLNFESISPTKQKEFSESILITLSEAIDSCNFTIITKLCALLSFNFSHSLTSILSFCTPREFVKIVMKFVDQQWSSAIVTKKEESDDSDEVINMSLSFSWALLLLINLNQIYDISLVNNSLNDGNTNLENSFSITFISRLSDIPDEFIIEGGNPKDTESQLKSHKLIQAWLSDLFVNGSISDNLMQNTDAKQLASTVPFIFKQVLYALEINAVADFDSIIGGVEYFLQPFMLSGLIKISFWLEDYLLHLKYADKQDDLINKVFKILNTIFNPNTLNEDSQTFHKAVLRINAARLLKIFRQFKKEPQANYGVYSSDSQEHSVLDTLIDKMVSVLGFSPTYYVDPRLLSSDSGYSQQKPLGYDRFMIFNENPVNKIMANQINSFWNLHSSTYYNLDYLKEVINFVTPIRFLTDVIQTLDYKLNTYGVPAIRNKITSIESEHVFDYLFYFLVLFDCETQIDAARMIQLFEDDSDYNAVGNNELPQASLHAEENNSTKNPVKTEDESHTKAEDIQDDDIDMLFGENETSTHITEEEVRIIDDVFTPKKFDDARALKRNSFGIILHDLKSLHNISYKNGNTSKDEYDRISKYHDKYLHMLKACVF
ncbi:similar to Saccharomyces cerevisiae YGL151W NUT1 Component of the RNA polymerase II mediator complex [Maudiozyma saulgeensis]|uniref:Mediator of RNA polymerase II transcription subunit 5 n=1 Tax=Maudiozyma saulgeensis TaxID=1789683 RepID=A0A1X7R1A8_9SACH|nr:similar to Saccharomyces cerevisiae YGL151W NUT1 Component of the RNA polymerase II mediator complex [Kazachstania saulgeensis]